MLRTRLLFLCLLLLLPPSLAQAGDEAACASVIPAAEARYGIPQGLLKAISKVESNLWPWTIDAAGEGHSFPSRAEAESKAATLRLSGLRNIDVGCMQISMLHHPGAFSSLSEAFDPEANVDYAARFLASLKRLSGDWEAAVARYHSATPILGQDYLRKVLAVWRGEEPTRMLVTRGFTVETRFGIHIWRPTSAANGQPARPSGHLILIKPNGVERR